MTESKAASFIAVDLGASGGKVSLGCFEGHSFELQEVHRFPNAGVSVWRQEADGPPVEQTYWNDLALYEHILDGLKKAAEAARAPIVSVGITTWGADAALLDADGEPLQRMYNYRDHRLDEIPARLAEVLSDQRIFELTGLRPQPWYLLNQLLWATRNRADLLPLVRTAVPVGGLFEFFLCGSKVAEQSWMAAQGLLDWRTGDYCDEILQATGIPRRILPKIVPPGTTLGNLHPPIAQRTGLAGCKVVAVNAHDTACAYTAAPAGDLNRSLIISSGTWSLVGKRLTDPIVTPEVLAAGLSNEGVRDDVRLLRNVMGTWPIQQLRAQWARADGHEMSWDEIVKLAEAAELLATLVDVDDPALFNPTDMHAAILTQLDRTGQSRPADRGPLLRAVYEGLAMKVAQVNRRLGEVTGTPQEVIHIVGGGSRNVLLNQFIADATNLPVHAGPIEATSIGNLLIQAQAGGAIDTLETGRRMIAFAIPQTHCKPAAHSPWTDAAREFRETFAKD